MEVLFEFCQEPVNSIFVRYGINSVTFKNILPYQLYAYFEKLSIVTYKIGLWLDYQKKRFAISRLQEWFQCVFLVSSLDDNLHPSTHF